MTRTTLPLILGCVVVAAACFAACSNTTEDDNPTNTAGGTSSVKGSGGANTARGAATSSGGARATNNPPTGNGGNVFGTNVPSNQGGRVSNNNAGGATSFFSAGRPNTNAGRPSAGNAGGPTSAGTAGERPIARAGASGMPVETQAGTSGSGVLAGAAGNVGSGGVIGNGGNGGSAGAIAQAGASGESPAVAGAPPVGAGGALVAGAPGAAGATSTPAATTCADGCAALSIPFTAAGQVSQFYASLGSTVSLNRPSSIVVKLYAPGADATIALKSEANAPCSMTAQSLAAAGNGYATLTFNYCQPSDTRTGVYALWLVVTNNAGTTTQTISIDSITINGISGGGANTLDLNYTAADTISTTPDSCPEGVLCAMSTGSTAVGSASWQTPGT